MFRFTREQKWPLRRPPEAFIRSLFNAVLGRDPSAQTMSSYLDHLAGGKKLVETIARCSLSNEARTRMVPTQAILLFLDELLDDALDSEKDRLFQSFRRLTRALHTCRTVETATALASPRLARAHEPHFSFWTTLEGGRLVVRGWLMISPERRLGDAVSVAVGEQTLSQTVVDKHKPFMISAVVPESVLANQPMVEARICFGASAGLLTKVLLTSKTALLLADSMPTVHGGASPASWSGEDSNLMESLGSTGAELLTPYVKVVALRHGKFSLAELEDETAPIPVFDWYLNDWANNSHCPENLPLSEAQREFLLEPCVDPRLTEGPATRAIFLFARRHKSYLTDLFGSAEGLLRVYARFLLTRCGGSLSAERLVPTTILAQLAERHPASDHLEFPINRFWHYILTDELETGPEKRRPEALPALEYRRWVAQKLVHTLTTGRHLSMIPNEWLAMMLENSDQIIQALSARQGLADERHFKSLFEHYCANFPQFRVLNPQHRTNVREQGLASEWPRLVNSKWEFTKERLWLLGHEGSSGLANNRQMFARALTRMGTPANDLFVERPLHDQIERGREGGTRLSRGALICAVNADRCVEELARLPRQMIGGCARIGFFLWETSRAPSSHREALKCMDEVWVPTEYVKRIFVESGCDTTVVNIGKHIEIPTQVTPLDRLRLGVRSSDFLFLAIADFDSSIIRKHPLAVVEAFRKAFPASRKDVKLVLKIRRIDPNHWSNQDNYWDYVLRHVRQDPRISVLQGNLSEADYWGLLKSADCYVTLHRSEGFGYGAAHCMGLGIPVITADYSGTQDFCNSETAFLVETRSIPVVPRQVRANEDVGVWGDPDADHAAEQMKVVAERSDLVRARVDAARALITNRYSRDQFEANLLSRLSRLSPEISTDPSDRLEPLADLQPNTGSEKKEEIQFG